MDFATKLQRPDMCAPRSRAGGRGIGFALATLSAAILPAMSAQAQTTRPNAGQLLQQTAPAPVPVQRENRGVVSPAVPTPQASASTATISVKAIRFSGNEHIDEANLRRAIPQISQLEGTTVGLAQLDALALAVTHYYRQRGYFVAVAYVPRQTVEDGTVTIAVLEGKLDQVRVEQSGGYGPAYLHHYEVEALCGESTSPCEGVTLTQSRADRAIGLVSVLPGVASASGTLSPGSTVGTSDFTLNAVPGPSVTGALGVDNYGNEYTGRVRETGGLRWNNPLGIGDLFTADMTLSDGGWLDRSLGRGALNGVIDYSLPIGYDGWRIGANYTHLRYRLGSPFDAVDAHGVSNEVNAYAAYPLVLSPNAHLWGRVRFGVKQLSDSVLEENYHTRDMSVTLSLNGDVIDTFAGGGLTQYAASFTRGLITHGDGARPIDTPNADAHFNKLNMSVSRDQTLGYLSNNAQRISLYGSLQGQLSNTNLNSVEGLTLGGPTGVRGYPVGEASGDEGAITTLELRDSFAVAALGGDNVTLSLFRDDGWLKVNHTAWPGYQGPLRRHLGSTGVGAELLHQNRYLFKVMWAMRDRGGELDTATHDQRSWLWLQAQIFF
ncbi:ShlB/FhaC/HecB family hemolysin secretion/activation protein [Burkholderia sp. HI2714]|uniref:ShlB/FhaC/HecB family hemolysin secretion/activation protein n=1 Tax=Burkholderia sp. HI2714 TaxID=2015359 RepID=UPI0015C5C74B|nr:ShlB/FhaC/HecB family hemolysin secretion/activation protein [Burkholderia sp. HI2714]